MIEDQQRAFGREHADGKVGIFCDALTPNSGGVDHHVGIQLAMFAVKRVIDAHTPHGITFADKTGDFMRRQNDCAMLARVKHVGGGQAERIDGSIGHFHCANERGIYRRLKTSGERGIEHFGANTRFGAGMDEGLLKREIVFGQGNKQAVGRLNAVAGDAFENLVFCDALAGGLVVGHRVARAAVQ
ncbi:hypothetical protein D3C80_945420 [compost metagenome]